MFAFESIAASVAVGVACASTVFCFFQAEDGIRYLVRSRGLGDVYKRQVVEPVELWTRGAWCG